MTEKRAILILSGGLDSATLLYDLMNQGIRPICLGFNYGQRHGKELEAAKHLCTMNGIEYKIISLADVVPLLKGSSQTDPSVPVPEGHYAQENMKLTVVPNRNMIMLSIAIAAAIGEKIPTVYYGAHAGDHDIYPDCRQSFVDAMKAAAALCDWTPVTIEAPYLNMTKGDICKKGMLLSVPYESTWTCYNPTIRKPHSSKGISVEEIVKWKPDTSVLSEQWVIGFLEGEGCFSESYSDTANPNTSYPRFSISQKNSPVLMEELKKFFGMGYISNNSGSASGMQAFEISGASQLRKIAYWLDGKLVLGKRKERFKQWSDAHGLLDFDAYTRPCGKCGSCTERLEAFDFAGATDPLIYAAEVK